VIKSYLHLGVNCNFCTYLALGSSNLFTASQADNVKALLLSNELLTAYKGTVIAGSLGDTTCMGHDKLLLSLIALILQALLASLALVTVMAWARMLATIPSLAWPSLIQSHQE
jgi:hypothetical protein